VAAVLEKHTGLRFSDQDIYVNVAGGMRLAEPGIDLALACALYSARSGQALPALSAVAGEISLAGEVRPVRQMRRRAKAAAALGFERIVGPSGEVESANAPKRGAAGARGSAGGDGACWIGVADVKAALKALFG
jgi:DNA repair protein RadA/Sms